MTQCLSDGKKRTIVIQGGPGTGKSVLAVNLLMEFVKRELNTSYVTKNSAPREAFLSILTNSDAKKMVDIKQLFRSPFNLAACSQNLYDCLIVDEAHEGVDTYKTDTAFDKINRKFTLHLSGTPFKALANDKFEKEAIYNWTYADEQKKKRELL